MKVYLLCGPNGEYGYHEFKGRIFSTRVKAQEAIELDYSEKCPTPIEYEANLEYKNKWYSVQEYEVE